MIFTALVDLPTVLDSMGFHVEVHPDWLEGQCNGDDHYTWSRPNGVGSHDIGPSAYMVHHTAGQSATPPDHQTSKANAWIGLKRGDRLYQYGAGVPTIYLATAGPARVSSGYGYKPAAWDYTFKQRRAPWKAKGPDGSLALNRYAFNVETVCEGGGTTLDRGVWECVVGLGRALEAMLVLREMTLGHVSWSRRKVDPDWSVGLPNDGEQCIIDIQDAIAAGEEDHMTTEQWASTLRNPIDFDQMAKKGIITQAERDYWVTVSPKDPEMQYLRNAVEVRGPLY